MSITNDLSEILDLWRNGESNERQIIAAIIACSVVYGKPFLDELREPTGNGDGVGVLEVVRKYAERNGAGA